MLERIKQALQNHYETIKVITPAFENGRKDILAMYSTAYQEGKLAEIKEKYDQAFGESIETNYNICLEVLNDIRTKVTEVISQAVNPSLTATLDAIRNIKEPTRAELEALTEAHKSNYLSYRAVCDAVGGRVAGFKVVSYDEIETAINDLQSFLHDCFYGRKVEGYNYQLAMKGTYIDNYDKLFSAFLEGRYQEAGELLKPDEE